MLSLSVFVFNLLNKCVVVKLGSKAGNFLSGKREGEGPRGGDRLRATEIEGRDREIEGRNRRIEGRDREIDGRNRKIEGRDRWEK